MTKISYWVESFRISFTQVQELVVESGQEPAGERDRVRVLVLVLGLVQVLDRVRVLVLVLG